MNKSTINKLFSNMCCNVCGHDFDDGSVKTIREEKGLWVFEIVCSECGKNFGLAILSDVNSSGQKKDEALEFMPCPMPVDYDEVLEAHEFIDKLEKDWNKYIPDELKDI